MSRVSETITGDIAAIVADFQARAATAQTPALRVACIYMAHLAPAIEAAHKQIAERPTTLDVVAHGCGSALASIAITVAGMFHDPNGRDALLKLITMHMESVLNSTEPRTYTHVGAMQ